jgi:hypothetical protein
LRIPAEDPRRFGADSGHPVADACRFKFWILTAHRAEQLKNGE